MSEMNEIRFPEIMVFAGPVDINGEWRLLSGKHKKEGIRMKKKVLALLTAMLCFACLMTAGPHTLR